MLKNFDFNVWPPNNPGAALRLALTLLTAANLVAAYFLAWPMGGSPTELRAEQRSIEDQLRMGQLALERTRVLAAKTDVGRGQGDAFESRYFLPRRTAYSAIVSELNDAAFKAKVRPKESAYSTEPVDGSDTLTMMQISANFECRYPDLIQFVNVLDKSGRLLIIEALNATPQQGSDLLNVNLKLDTFVREDGSAL